MGIPNHQRSAKGRLSDKTSRIGLPCLALLLLGCANAPIYMDGRIGQRNTPSWRPELTIDTDKQLAMDAIVGSLRREGYAVWTANASSVILRRPVAAVTQSHGLPVAATSSLLVTLNFSLVPGGVLFQRKVPPVHVRGRVEVLENPWEGYPILTDIRVMGVELQTTLARAQEALETGYLGMAFGRDFVISEVVPASPAEVGGLRMGDRIEMISGVALMSYKKAKKLMEGRPDTEVVFNVVRDGNMREHRLWRRRYADVHGSQWGAFGHEKYLDAF